jgi:hypothetical protein
VNARRLIIMFFCRKCGNKCRNIIDTEKKNLSLKEDGASEENTGMGSFDCFAAERFSGYGRGRGQQI